MDIIFAEAEAIGCVVDYYYDAASVSTKKKKNGSVASNEVDDDDDEKPFVLLFSGGGGGGGGGDFVPRRIFFWVQLNDKMLDETQQEDLRAFLQDSLLPEKQSHNRRRDEHDSNDRRLVQKVHAGVDAGKSCRGHTLERRRKFSRRIKSNYPRCRIFMAKRR